VTGGPGPDGAAPGRATRPPWAKPRKGAGASQADRGKPVTPARPLLAPETGGTRRRARQIAGGIYGTIVTASIMATAGGELTAAAEAVAVLITLTVYWIAHEYADLLGSHIAGDQLPGWRDIRGALTASWTMVSASYLPLIVLLAATVAGAAATDAASAGLIAAALELVLYALAAGRAAELGRRPQLLIAASAAALGLAMIALKIFVLTHLH
jgi:hypothetical protein